MILRREFLKQASVATAAQTALRAAAANTIVVDPQPLFDISPWLYMQFMEPLGATDSTVEAAWDYDSDDWRKDFVETVKDLAPGAVRFGGLFSRHYKWREGVGPAGKRPTIRNYFCSRQESNRVGTHEFVDFCRRVGAEPFYCVNFLSDGEKRFRTTPEGDRTGDAREAADWVSYANDPDSKERKQNGVVEPYHLKLWQLGNETSYGNRTFTRDESIAAQSSKAGIAITEGHLSLTPHNANPILSEWLSAVYHARSLNIYQRHGARVKIATAADFQGNRWTVNAVMLQTPRGVSYLMPVASIARLFKKYNGKQGVDVKTAPSSLDIAASRTAERVYLHVANLEYKRPVEATFAIAGMKIGGGRVYEIAPEDLRQYVDQDQPDAFKPRVSAIPSGPDVKWRFPAGSVSAVELDVRPA